MPRKMFIGLVLDPDEDDVVEVVRAINQAARRGESIGTMRNVSEMPPRASAEAVAKAREWMRADVVAHLKPATRAIRDWLVQLAKNPPPERETVSYRQTRADLGLTDDPYAATAWPKLLGGFYAKTGTRLLDRRSRPLRDGVQDTIYDINMAGAEILRTAADTAG